MRLICRASRRLHLCFSASFATPSARWCPILAVLAALFAAASPLIAGPPPQTTLSFQGVQSTLSTGSTYTNPAEVAVDAAGDVFVLDSSTGYVSEIVAVNGAIPASPTIQVLANSFVFQNSFGMAIDANGNLFLPGGATLTAMSMYEIPASNRNANPTQLGGTFNTPYAVALDSNGNIFVDEDGPNDVKELSFSSGYTTVTTPITGLASPAGVAIDSSGNIFVADGSGSSIKEFTAASGYSTYTGLSQSFGAILNMSIDAVGNLYVADSDNMALYEILAPGGYTAEITLSANFVFPTGVAVAANGNLFISDAAAAVDEIQRPGTNLGSLNLGLSSPTQTLLFDFAGTNTSVSWSVLTLGATGLDFQEATGTTCADSANTNCAINVTFQPTAAGLRRGAVLVTYTGSDSTVKNIAIPIYATADAPQMAFEPGTVSAVSTGGGTSLAGPYQSVVDGAGNIYATDTTNNVVVKIPAGGGAATTLTLTPAPTGLQGIAIDGAGDLYISDSAAGNIKVLNTSGYSGVLPIVGLATPLSFPGQIAMDGEDQLYIADFFNNRIVKVAILSAGDNSVTGIGSVVATGSYSLVAYGGVFGVAADPAGNVYATQGQDSGRIIEIAPSDAVSVLNFSSSIEDPVGIDLDGFSNLYVSDYQLLGTPGGNLIEEQTTSGVNQAIPLPGFTLANPGPVSFDSAGQVYIPDNGNGRILKLEPATPYSPNFDNTAVNATSADSPHTFTIVNTGDRNLHFTSILYPADFPVNTADTNLCSTANLVPPGGTCDISVDFVPASSGSLTENIVLNDNNLYADSATQSIPVAGTGFVPDTTATAVTVSPTSLATGLTDTLSATVTDTTNSGTTPTGTVTFTDTFGGSTTTAASNVALVSGAASYSYTVSGVGSHTITASYTPSGAFASSSGTTSLTVVQATPTISWATPAPIIQGTALSSTQLNATSSVAGAFVYSPASGTAPSAGVVPLSVTFTPTDTADYTTATATVNLLVLPAPQGFGNVAVGSTSSQVTITFPFASAVTLGTPGIQVLTDGATGSAFANAGTGTCAAGGGVSADASCTVAVTFSPQYPGLTHGAVILLDGSSNVLTTVYLSGVGTAPMVNFLPGTPALVAGTESPYNLQQPASSQVDANGNVYVADHGGNAVYKETPSGSGYVQTTLPATGLSLPEDVAVDGAGNVFIADSNNLRVVELVNAGGTYTQSTILNLNYPGGIAVDTQGNLFVSTVNDGFLYKETLANGSYTQTTVASGLNQPRKVAVDAAGNVYVADSNNGRVLKETPNGSGYTQSVVLGSLSEPYGVAVDVNGKIYIADRGDGNIYVEQPSESGYTNFQTYPGGFGGEASINVDQQGNLYGSSLIGNGVFKLDRFDPPTFDYSNTLVGQTDSAGPSSFTFLNQGNDTLTVSVPGSGLNPTLTSGYDLSASTTCTRVAAGGSAIQFAPNANCLYGVEFKPVAAGLDTGTLVFTDNSLNAVHGTQSVGLSGTGIVPDVTATALSISPGTISYFGTATLTATVTDTTNSGTAPTGTVNFTDTFNGVTTSVASAVNFTGNVATTSYFGASVGSHTITATYVPAGNFVASTKTAALVVSKATPTIAWAEPAPIQNGTNLAGVLNALASGVQDNVERRGLSSSPNGIHPDSPVAGLSGTYAYTATPSGGSASAVTTATILATGAYQLGVVFTPTDTADYTIATATVTLLVLPVPHSFGSVAVGTTSSPATITIPFSAAVTLGAFGVQVLTQGTPDLDFANAGTGTCTAGSNIAAGTSCTVRVTFTPRYPGYRFGAVELLDSSGNMVATVYLSGQGNGPLVDFQPLAQSTAIPAGAPFNLGSAQAIAVDAAGRLFVADNTNNAIYLETPNASGYTQTTVVTGVISTQGVTVDGQGNVYAADWGNNRVVEMSWNGSAWVMTNSWPANLAAGVAVDAQGDVFLCSWLDGAVYKETLAAGSYSQSLVTGGLNQPRQIAADGAGNVYISDTGNSRVVKETWTGSGYTQTVIGSGMRYESGVAIDGSGNVYVDDGVNNRILKEVPSEGTYLQSVVANVGSIGLAVDGHDRLYLPLGTSVLVLDPAIAPNLSFATPTLVDTTDTADGPQSVTVANDGNASLTLPAPGSGMNPSLSNANFSLDNATTCPKVNHGGSPATLAAQSSCVYAVDFAPVATGALTATLTLKDDNLNDPASTQAIALSGAGFAPDATATALSISPATISYDSSATLTATVTDTTNSGTTPTGTVNFTDTFNGVTTSVASAVNFTGNVASTSYFATTVGSHTIKATYVPAGNFAASSNTGSLTVIKATPTIAWAEPAPIQNGTNLAGILNALASGVQQDVMRIPGTARRNGVHSEGQIAGLSGTYAYTATPSGGSAGAVTAATILPIGTYQLGVTFTPTDSADYTSATASVTLLVLPPPASFGAVAVGTVSTTIIVTVPVASAVTLGTPGVEVLTQGATGLDFANAGTGTCTNGKSLIAGETCTVAVTFTPVFPGPRYGAALIEDGSGNVLATVYLHGVGVGSQALFPPGTQTMLTPDTTTYWPEGLAVDSKLNLFFVDGNSNDGGGAIIELPWTGVAYGEALAPASLNLPGSGYIPAGSLAVDGAGNLYTGVTNSTSGSVLKFPWNGTSYGNAIWLGTGLVDPIGIAVDGNGNLFIADPTFDGGYQQIVELPWVGGPVNSGYGSQATIASPSALGGIDGQYPYAIAVDSSGNLFFIGQTSSTTANLMEIPFVSGSYSASYVTLDDGLFNPYGVVVDTNGNLYVDDTNGSGKLAPVYEYLLSGGIYAARTQLFTTPYGGGGPIALDSAGSLYVDWNTGDSVGSIYKQNRAALPSAVFAHPTLVDSPDTADNPQAVALLNYGNASLTFASSSSGANPSLSGGGFSLDAATTCPKVAAGGAASFLNANSACLYQVDLTPTAVGSIGGTLTLTDNSLNVSGTTQSIALSGTGLPLPATKLALSGVPAQIAPGGNLGIVAVDAENVDGVVATGSTASITVTITGPGSFSQAVTGSAVNGIFNANLSGISLPAPGTYTLTATSSSLAPATATVAVALNLTANASALAFGSVPVGASSPTQTLIVTNPNAFALIGVSATATGDFSASSNCPSVAESGTCSINVTFTPTAFGARGGTLRVGDALSGNQLTVALSGSGTAGSIQFNTDALAFGDIVTGTTSVGQTVTIQNTGVADLVVSNISTTGDFATSGNCETIPPGSNCSLTVTFTPTAIGARTGALTLTDNAGGSGQTQTLNLSGLGSVPGATLTPNLVTFPGTGVGSKSFGFTTTLTNTGINPLTGISISILGDFTETSACTASLPSGASCDIEVTYSPSIPGAETGALIVADNLGTQTAALTGTGIAPGVSLNTGRLLFGGQLLGTSSLAQTVVFSNTGSTAIGISSVAASSGFTDTTNCTGSIESGASCSVNVSFAPTSAGAATGTLTLVDTAGTQVVTLSGQGVSPGLAIAPSFAIFGAQTVGTSSPAETLTVTNTSLSPLTLNPIAVSNGFAVASQCPEVLDAGSTCTVSLSFEPTSIGAVAGSLVVSDMTGSFSTPATVSGQGALPGVAASPASLSFGSLPLGVASQGQTVTVLNAGAEPLKIGAVSGTGDFAETDTCSHQTVAPGGYCVISVTMTPTTAGTRTGAVQFDNSADGLHTIALSGVGQNAGVSITPTSLAFGSAPIAASNQGQAGTTLNVVLGNTSAGMLNLSGLATQGDFSESSSCGATLDPGDTCTLTVTFLPTALGHRTGTLTLTDNAGGDVQTVSLAGDGSPAGLILTPPVLDFGVQPKGVTSKPLTATLSNNTGKSIIDLSIVASGEYEETDNCGTALANAASCTLQIFVTPATTGAITGTVAISGGGVVATLLPPDGHSIRPNGASSVSGIGVVATLADTTGASTISQLAFGIGPPPMIAAGGNAGAAISVGEYSSSGSIAAGTDTITLTVTGPGSYVRTYTAKASGGVAVFNLSGYSLTVAGKYTYTVTVASKGSIGAASVTEIVNAGAASSVSPTAGNRQSAIIDQPFSTELEVTVKDAYGNAVSGVTVTFAAPAAGASAKLSGQTAVTGVAGTASVTATANGIPGAYEITASVAGATQATFSLTNSSATPAVTLVTSSNRILLNSVVTFTATLTGTVGPPTGTVRFNDGKTLLGSGTIDSGTVVFTTSSLSAGVHSITAAYSGDTIFSSATSAALTQTVVDYAVNPSGVPAQTIPPGGSANYVVTVTPTEGVNLPAAATLTVTGLPTGATVSLTPASTLATWTQLNATSWELPAGTTLGDISLTFGIPGLATTAFRPEKPGRSASPLVWALLLLPFAARFRRAGRRMRRALLLLLCLAASGVAMVGFSGCGARNGFFGQPPTNYEITVTVTAGSLSHSTNLTLKVE